MNIFIGSAAVHGVLMMTLLFEPTDVAALSQDLFHDPVWSGCLCCVFSHPDPPLRVQVVGTIGRVNPPSRAVRSAAEEALRFAERWLPRCASGEKLPRHSVMELRWVLGPRGAEVTVRHSNLPARVTECMAGVIELFPELTFERRHAIELDLGVVTHWDPVPGCGH